MRRPQPVKNLVEFLARRQEINSNRFLRRRVRRTKHLSRSERRMATVGGHRGAERSASPFVRKGFVFFDKLRAAHIAPPFLFSRIFVALCNR